MDRTIEDINGFRVEVVSKPEESRAFFRIIGKIDPEDKTKKKVQTGLTREDENMAALFARQWYESHENVMFVRFGKDPMAGGLKPSSPVEGQQYIAGKRFARIKTAHSQEFPENQEIMERGGAVPVQGNVSSGAARMVNTPMWAAEW